MNEWCIVDDDLTTVLFDFDDSTGSNNPYNIQTAFGLGGSFNLGTPDPELEQVMSSSRRGGYTVFSNEGLVKSSWRQRILGLDFEQLSDAVGYLGLLLSQSRVIKVSLANGTRTRYIHYEPSKAPALLDGKNYELQYVVQRFDTLDGVDIELFRQPDLRSDELSTDNNLLYNPTLIIARTNPDRPEGYSWDSTTNIDQEDIDIDTNAYLFRIATASARDLSGTVATGIAAGNNLTAQVKMRAGQNGVVQMKLFLKFRDSGHSNLTTLFSDMFDVDIVNRKFTFTAVAPASTAEVIMGVRFNNVDATAVKVHTNLWKLERGTDVGPFVPTTVEVKNDPDTVFGHVFPFYIEGDYSAPVKLLFKGVSGSSLGAVSVAQRTDGGVVGSTRLPVYVNSGMIVQCESGTTYTDASKVADGGASGSGNNAVEINYTTVEGHVRRLKIVISGGADSSLKSLRGVFDLYIRAKALDNAVHVISAEVGTSTADPPAIALPETRIDTTDASSFGWQRKYLGRWNIPTADLATVTDLTLNILTSRIDGTDKLHLDYIEFVPADEKARYGLIAPPINSGAGGQHYRGSDFSTPTTDPAGDAGVINSDRGYLNLNVNGESGMTPSFSPVVGHHKFAVLVSTYKANGEWARVGELRIRDLTSHTDVSKTSIVHPAGITWDQQTWVVEFDSTSGHTYELQAWHIGTAEVIDIFTADYSYSFTLTQDGYFSSDAENFRVGLLNTSNKEIATIPPQGPTPIVLEPGWGALMLWFGNTALPGNLEPEDAIGSSSIVSMSYQPRWRGL